MNYLLENNYVRAACGVVTAAVFIAGSYSFYSNNIQNHTSENKTEAVQQDSLSGLEAKIIDKDSPLQKMRPCE